MMKKKNNKVEQKKQQQNVVEEKVQLIKPIVVEYCPICTYPFEFCQWSDKPILCKQWKSKNRPQLISEAPQGEVKPQKKKEQVKQQKVTVEKNKLAFIVFDVKQRVKKKYITTIFGLQHFNINAKQFSKKCSKKFACSCNVVDDTKIQIQGDISQQIFDFMESEYQIKDKYILDNEEYEKKVKKQKQKQRQKYEKQKAQKLQKKEQKKKQQKKQPEAQTKPQTKPTQTKAQDAVKN